MRSRRASWRGLVWGNMIQWPGFFRRWATLLLALVLLVAFVVAPSGCAHVVTAAELKEEHPHLTLVEICMRPYGVPNGATVWVTNDVLGDIVANTDPERLREAAAGAHYVFQFDPNAPQSGLASMRNPLPGVQCHLPLLSQNQLEELRARRPAHTMHDQVRAWLRREEVKSQVRRNRPFVGISFDEAFGELSPEESLPIDHPSAPEGYTVDGRPGKKPWQYHLGYSAHIVIAKHYEVMHPGHTVYRNHTSIMTIVSQTRGNPGLLNWTNASLRPDIVDMETKVLFEIKPRGEQHLIDGKAQADKYIGALNSALPSDIIITHGVGYSGSLGVRFAKDVEPWNIQWETTAPGVVQYRLRKLRFMVALSGGCATRYTSRRTMLIRSGLRRPASSKAVWRRSGDMAKFGTMT